MTRLWGGRFASEPAPEMIAFTRSAGFDVRLVRADGRVLAAHALALAGAGILEPARAAAARELFDAVAADIESGTFAVSPEDEDVHTTVERALRERDPDLAARIRAGLSRNDRVATAFRLWIAGAAQRLSERTAALAATLASRAADHEATVMPGYTHLQRAQPVTLALHLRAHAAALARAERRLVASAEEALSACPLGAGALAGSTLGLDSETAARTLGFRAPAENPLDAVADRDFAATFLFACATLAVSCSRLGEEIVLWSTAEFGFARIDDAWATGSSLMPQKRNPDVAELARGKAARLIGHLTTVLAMLKSLPLAYNRDLQEDKEPVFDAAETLDAMLPALDGVVRTLSFDVARMREAADDPALLATDVAERLVLTGVSFGEAHEVVGRAARRAAELGTDLLVLEVQELAGIHAGLPEAIRGIDAEGSVRARSKPRG